MLNGVFLVKYLQDRSVTTVLPHARHSTQTSSTRLRVKSPLELQQMYKINGHVRCE